MCLNCGHVPATHRRWSGERRTPRTLQTPRPTLARPTVPCDLPGCQQARRYKGSPKGTGNSRGTNARSSFREFLQQFDAGHGDGSVPDRRRRLEAGAVRRFHAPAQLHCGRQEPAASSEDSGCAAIARDHDLHSTLHKDLGGSFSCAGSASGGLGIVDRVPRAIRGSVKNLFWWAQPQDRSSS